MILPALILGLLATAFSLPPRIAGRFAAWLYRKLNKPEE